MSRHHDDGHFSHLPVMVDEVVATLAPVPAGVVLDATVGGGGHAAAVLDAHPHLHILGIDQDPAAVAAATFALAWFGSRVDIRRARFDRLNEVVDGAGVGRLSVVRFD